MIQTETQTRLIAHILAECSKIDVERQFDDMLDECYSFEKVGGPFEGMSPSSVLRLCDETAHRCGLNDWADGQRDQWTEIDGDWYETREVEKQREAFVDTLKDELADLENEKAKAGGTLDATDPGQDRMAETHAFNRAALAVDSKQLEIDEAEAFTF
jgi:hypothetical protein